MISLLKEPSPTRWLSLKQASALLGVNANSLRSWADQGAVRSFRTPGGHRRFSETDLLALTDSSLKSAPSSQPDKAIARIRRKMTASPMSRETWIDLLPHDQIDELRGLGRRLVELAVEYLDNPKAHAAINVEGRSIGERYGRLLGAQGLAFSQMLETFLFFRNQVETHVSPQSNPAQNGSGAHRSSTGLLDQVLLGAVRGYEEQLALRPTIAGTSLSVNE